MFKNLLGQGTLRTPFLAPEDLGGGGSGEGVTNLTPATTTTDGGQANVQPQGQESFTNVDPNTLPPELQGIYKNLQGDYTRKMQEVSPWRKTVEQFGGMTPEQLRQQVEFAQYVQNPEYTPKVIKDYIQQNPQMFATLVQELGPQLAMQNLFGGNFGQKAQDPYAELADISDSVEYARKHDQIREQLKEKEWEQKYGQRIGSIEQNLKQQRDSAIKSNVDTRLDAYVKNLADAGITKESIWGVINAEKIPMEALQQRPWLVESAVIQAAGGIDKYNEIIGNSKVKNYTTQVQQNQKVATTTPVGGVFVSESQVPIVDGDKLKQAARDMWAKGLQT